MSTTSKLVGYASVDAGIIWIGDPCYVMGADASHGVKDWNEYCEKSFAGPDAVNPDCRNNVCEPLGKDIGFEIGGFGGDGSWPVIVTTGSDGLVVKAEILFGYSVDSDPEYFGGDDDEYEDDYDDWTDD